MKYIFGVLAVIIVLIVGTVLLLNRDDKPQQQTGEKAPALVDYAKRNSTVSFTTYGRLVGEEDRRAIRIVVTPSERRLEVLSGYDQTTISTQSFPNTQSAYENFLSALNNAGFIASQKSAITDPRGICPGGNRFAYVLSENGDNKSDLWTTSCDAKQGTFAGNSNAVRNLFQTQIPDYKNQVKAIKL